MIQEPGNVGSENSSPNAHTVFYRTYNRRIDSRQWAPQKFIEPELLTECIGKRVYQVVEQTFHSLLKNGEVLSKMDERLGRIVRPLKDFSNGITFEPLGEIGFQSKISERTLAFNLEVVKRLARSESGGLSSDELATALVVYMLHEIGHISQRLMHYEDVQRIKCLGEDGRHWLAELDLRNDFLAVRALALLRMQLSCKTYNGAFYVEEFYRIWCRTCRKMLNVFPAVGQRHKQKRIFGYFLMANLAREAYLQNSFEIGFDAELWPRWNDSLNWLSVSSRGLPFFAGGSVNPHLMQQILLEITEGKYDAAEFNIGQLWRQLPRL